MEIQLPDDLARDLSAEADKQRISAQQLAVQYIRQHVPPAPTNVSDDGAMTMYDYLKDFIGVIHSGEKVPGGANLSQDTGKKFTELLLKKRAQGKL